MQTIHILAVGGLREAAFADACGEYQKRLGAHCKLVITEVAEHRLPRNPGETEILQCIQQESRSLMAKLPPKAYVAAMCIEGKQLTSPGLADKLEQVSLNHSQLAFVIGGSHGLSQELKSMADLLLSMSVMTFPHQLARVMLMEQIYRAFSIINGSKYHK